MTQGGNHGGADLEEKSAAMIMAAKRPLYYAPLLRQAGCGQSYGILPAFANVLDPANGNRTRTRASEHESPPDSCVEAPEADTGDGIPLLATDPTRYRQDLRPPS